MVSIHIIPVIVYLIIRVISCIFRFKREALHCRSLHVLRLLRIALFVETSNAEAPRRYVYMFLRVPTGNQDVRIHLWPACTEGLYITYPRGIHRCFVFDKHFEIFSGFQNVKTKA